MDREKRRRFIALMGLVVGMVFIALSYRDPLHGDHPKLLLFGALFVVLGGLALLGVNVWKGGPLDPRWDLGGPPPPPEVMRTERLSEDPFRPGQRWLPMDFATFPRRCVACGKPPVGVWKVRLTRGVELLVYAFHQVNWVEAPVCGHCRRQRRLASFLSFIMILSPWFVLFFLDEGLHVIDVTAPWLVLGFALFLVALGFARSWGPPLFDRALLGVCGVRLEKGGRSGWLWFRSRELAEEVVALTRARMFAAENLAEIKLPSYSGTV